MKFGYYFTDHQYHHLNMYSLKATRRLHSLKTKEVNPSQGKKKPYCFMIDGKQKTNYFDL